MRDSPDSFNRMRSKTGSATRRDPRRAAVSEPPGELPPVTSPSGRASLPDREADEPLDADVLAGLGREVGAQLLDGLAVVLVAVDMLLVQQDDLAVPLLELTLDDARAHVLGLVGGELLEDADLAVLVLLRDL